MHKRVFAGGRVPLLIWPALLIGWVSTPQEAGAQEEERLSPPPVAVPLISLGSPAEDRLRLQHLLGQAPTSGFLLRSPSELTRSAGGTPRRWSIALVAPELEFSWNSTLPFSFNDGLLWAGRGTNVRAHAGVTAAFGPLSVVLAPELVHQQNADFQILPYERRQEPPRSPFASPWHHRPSSIDHPSRPGDEPITRLWPGQSSITATLGPVATGFATENLWWGPGIRNAIVMSSHAPGFPHVFLRTAGPRRTRLGEIGARWILGTLRESEFFDSIPDNDHRSLSGFAVTVSPRWDPRLTLGVARAVFASQDRSGISPVAALDAFRSVPYADTAPTDSAAGTSRDQIFSVFGRWVFPRSGVEAYFEWARFRQPQSIAEFLAEPESSQGYTLGAQWAEPVARGAAIRLQGELTYLEPSSPERQDIEVSWYASRSVAQGYTNRGQVIGAGIGPGASSQWVAADYLAPGWRAGLFAGRIRWDNAAAFYQLPPMAVLRFLHHDVSLFSGARGGVRIGPFDATAELIIGTRFNYLFQHRSTSFEDIEAVDLRNTSFRLLLSPRPRPR